MSALRQLVNGTLANVASMVVLMIVLAVPLALRHSWDIAKKF